MPLPPALAAKLAKRGFFKKTAPEKEQVEEVFAENYDEPSQSAPKKRLGDYSFSEPDFGPPKVTEEVPETDDTSFGGQVVHQISACPNTVNPYHTCSDFCSKKWGYKKFKPDPKTAEKKQKMLAKYPIPDGWMEVGDPNTGRCYYWNIQTDEVSWLSPKHPKASISLPAERLKELNNPNVNKKSKKRRDSQGESSDESKSDQSDHEIPEKREVVIPKKKKRKPEELDPMDPAAYSDVPRGSWTTGLDQRGSAKTGVDVTASGPLFQQRPYPSPGAVLRINKTSKDVKK